MILAIAAALAAAAPAGACPDVVTPDALVCRALEAQKAGDNATAAQSFEEAAKASLSRDPKTARMWAAAGNLWIAAGEAGKAALDLDKALAMGGLEAEQRGEALLDRALALPGLIAEQRGEALLDRARAAESQGDLKTARARLNEAAPTVSDDPFFWYFSAALAIREGDAPNAQTAIGKALSLAPNDPTILFEAGHVAHFAGEDARARYYWERAAAIDPNSDVGKAARAAVDPRLREPLLDVRRSHDRPRRGDVAPQPPSDESRPVRPLLLEAAEPQGVSLGGARRVATRRGPARHPRGTSPPPRAWRPRSRCRARGCRARAARAPSRGSRRRRAA